MAVQKLPPITGMFQRRLIFNIGGSLTLGTVLAYAYWYYSYVPYVNARTKRDLEFYNQYISEHPEHGKI